MPTSEKQIEANRRNARKSTGPSTPEGKAAIRHNALKHGILARETVITRDDFQEDATEFETLLADLTADRDPHGPLEGLLVQEIAICYWRLRRILRADTMEFGEVLAQQDTPTFEIEGRTYQSYPPSLPPADQLDTILRYEKAIHNQLARALSQLERLQQQRKSTAMSTVTPSRPSTPPENGETTPIAPRRQPAAADADPVVQATATKQSHLPASTARSKELRELEQLMQEAQQTVGLAPQAGTPPRSNRHCGPDCPTQHADPPNKPISRPSKPPIQWSRAHRAGHPSLRRGHPSLRRGTRYPPCPVRYAAGPLQEGRRERRPLHARAA